VAELADAADSKTNFHLLQTKDLFGKHAI